MKKQTPERSAGPGVWPGSGWGVWPGSGSVLSTVTLCEKRKRTHRSDVLWATVAFRREAGTNLKESSEHGEAGGRGGGRSPRIRALVLPGAPLLAPDGRRGVLAYVAPRPGQVASCARP